MKNLENNDLVELDSFEMIEIDGGFWQFVGLAIASYVIGEFIDGTARYASGERMR